MSKKKPDLENDDSATPEDRATDAPQTDRREAMQSRVRSLDKAARDRLSARWDSIERKRAEIDEIGPIAYADRQGRLFDVARRFGHMTRTEGLTFESIIGSNDLSQVNFLGRGVLAARQVCRLVDRLSNQGLGTGFLVGPGIVLTNAHVIADPGDASALIAEFDYEYDVDDRLEPTTRIALDPARVFVNSPPDELDYTFVALAGDPALHRGRGWIPMDPSTNKVLEGEPILIIQHPGGETKQISLFSSVCIDRNDDFLLYTTDTRPGSSGSPAFNRYWQLVALHHAATQTDKKHLGAVEIANEGIRVSSIMTSLRTGEKVACGANEQLHALLTHPDVIGDGRPTGAVPVERTAVVAPASPGVEAVARRMETSISRKSPSHFDGRDGYDAGFLALPGSGRTEFLVPLPVIPKSMDADVLRTSAKSDPTVLKYMHYSLVMSVSRRLAIFTACNIDGATLQPGIDRKDRDPDRPKDLGRTNESLVEEAADRWFYDPRIPTESQTGPDIYDGTAFDYGHLTRRLDPVWGDDRTLRIANDDTFMLTNCAPQHENLNRKTWLALEDAIYSAALTRKKRFSVFTGPIFSPRDSEIRGVAVPNAYWKVVAYVDDNGALASLGFIEWQTDLVESERRRLETVLEPSDPIQVYRYSLLEIARLTNLDFGPLMAVDTPIPIEHAAAPGTPQPRIRRMRVTEANVSTIFA